MAWERLDTVTRISGSKSYKQACATVSTVRGERRCNKDARSRYEEETAAPRMDFVVASLAGVAELYEDDLRTRHLGGSIVGWQKQHRVHYARKM